MKNLSFQFDTVKFCPLPCVCETFRILQFGPYRPYRTLQIQEAVSVILPLRIKTNFIMQFCILQEKYNISKLTLY